MNIEYVKWIIYEYNLMYNHIEDVQRDIMILHTMIICDVYIIMLGNPNYTVDNLVYKISDDV